MPCDTVSYFLKKTVTSIPSLFFFLGGKLLQFIYYWASCRESHHFSKMHYLTSPNTACLQLERFSNGHILDIPIHNVIYPKNAAAHAPTRILKYWINSVQLDFMIYSRTERKAHHLKSSQILLKHTGTHASVSTMWQGLEPHGVLHGLGSWVMQAYSQMVHGPGCPEFLIGQGRQASRESTVKCVLPK